MKERDELLGRLEELRPRMQRLFALQLPAEVRVELGAVTLHQLDVLRQLGECANGSLTMRELATGAGVGASAATQMVDRLVRDGLVERYSDEADRRVVRVRVTERTAGMIARLKAARREVGRRALAPLDDAELASFVTLTERVVDGAGSNGETPR